MARDEIGSNLKVFATGRWANNLNVLDGVLINFSKQHERVGFGNHSFQFEIINNDPLGEWMIAFHSYDRTHSKNASFDFPYGEIGAEQVSGFVHVEFLYLSMRNEDAIKGYLKELLQVLVNQGLRLNQERRSLKIVLIELFNQLKGTRNHG